MSERPLVLIVDDDAVQRRILSIMVEKFGGRPCVVASAAEALFCLAATPVYSLILMDWRMPGLDGLECTRFIRRWEQLAGLSRIAIVAITARAMAGDREECLRAGADLYLSKPFAVDEFKERYHEALRLSPNRFLMTS